MEAEVEVETRYVIRTGHEREHGRNCMPVIHQ